MGGKKEEKKEEKKPSGPCGEMKALQDENDKLDVGKTDEYDKFMANCDEIALKADMCRAEKAAAAQKKADETYEATDLTMPNAAHDHDSEEGMVDGKAATDTAANVEKEQKAIDKHGF